MFLNVLGIQNRLIQENVLYYVPLLTIKGSSFAKSQENKEEGNV